MIVGIVIVLVSPDVTVGANVVCSDKILLNVVMMLSIFGVDKLMGFSMMESCSVVFVTRTESVKYTNILTTCTSGFSQRPLISLDAYDKFISNL